VAIAPQRPRRRRAAAPAAGRARLGRPRRVRPRRFVRSASRRDARARARAGFPTETEEDFQQSLALLEKYKFPIVNIAQVPPRPDATGFVRGDGAASFLGTKRASPRAAARAPRAAPRVPAPLGLPRETHSAPAVLPAAWHGCRAHAQAPNGPPPPALLADATSFVPGWRGVMPS
jgi:hypothetical protein